MIKEVQFHIMFYTSLLHMSSILYQEGSALLALCMMYLQLLVALIMATLMVGCGRNHMENLKRHFMAKKFDGIAWAILGDHIISSQGHKQLHTYHKWREKQMKKRKSISPCIPITLDEPRVENIFELTRLAHFIWMIAWVWKSLIGNNAPHVHHHSYLEEAIEKYRDHHLYPPFSHDVHLLSYTWRKSWEDIFIAYHFQPWRDLLMRP